jgi:hypothetical protein
MTTHVVYYNKKITNANTVYTQIDVSDLDLIMSTLRRGLYDLLERSNYDNAAKDCLTHQDETFRKHLNAGKHQHNSLGSFLGGLLAQHEGNVKKDISEKMLAGIHLASKVFAVFNEDSPEIVFVEKKDLTTKPTTIFDQMFGAQHV